ncbi:MAG: hypothetical protein M1826_005263 [Phylliscum demangeonii]|nr:MAG: hypothetical protein M1826_005263 [Phylliscum demangeonii]
MDAHDICSYEEWSDRPEIQRLAPLAASSSSAPDDGPVNEVLVTPVAAADDGGGGGGGGGVNWMGQLLEFYAKSHSASRPTFKEFSGDHHACECVIPNRPDHVFGGRERFFATKKAARAQPARAAYEWLQAERVAGRDVGTPSVLSLPPTLSSPRAVVG